jgi:hypothetical protein
MKRIVILYLFSAITCSIIFADGGITRGPAVGEIYFLGPTATGEGLYRSTDFGETATCMDSTLYSNIDFGRIAADITPGVIYAYSMPENLWISYNYGQEGSWIFRSNNISQIHSGRTEGYIYAKTSRHSEDYGISFINHTCNGYFGSYKASEIDNEENVGYVMVYEYGNTDSLWLLISNDDFENFEIQHSFSFLSPINSLSRGFQNGELYYYTYYWGIGDGRKLRYSNDYGETWELKNTFNCPNLRVQGIVGGRQPGELFINVEYIQDMSTIKHTYIYHSVDYGETFTVYHPFSYGPEPYYAKFEASSLSGTAPLTVQFTDTSSGEDVCYWEWDFNHDEIIDSYEQNPVYCFADSGIYRTSLCINDGYPDFIDEKYAERIIFVNGSNSSEDNQLPASNIQLFNYPNPFNPSTVFSYELPVDIESTNIELYNLRGQLIDKISIDSSQSETIWDANKFPSGIYLYKLDIKNSPINKMILLK